VASSSQMWQMGDMRRKLSRSLLYSPIRLRCLLLTRLSGVLRNGWLVRDSPDFHFFWRLIDDGMR
jgi:hypothetical protein